MTGIEALSLLKEGKTLRRESWEPHEKCKALDFFGKWIIHLEKAKNNKILDKEIEKIFQNSFAFTKTTFDDFFGLFDKIEAGEFLYDDWEIVE
jgi:hypothetical protein